MEVLGARSVPYPGLRLPTDPEPAESAAPCASEGRDGAEQKSCVLLHCSERIKLASRVTAGQEAGNNEDKVSFQRCDPLQAVRQKTINN